VKRPLRLSLARILIWREAIRYSFVGGSPYVVLLGIDR
jgi:hypothetical protein